MDKRVLITGGSSGIGLSVAEQLDRAGARVVLVARGREGLDSAAERLSRCAGTIAADVSDPAAVNDAVARAAQLLGGGLDAVVANAGAAAYGPFADMAPDDYGRTIATTLLGMINTAHAAIPQLERTRGTFVVVGSVAGRVPTPWLASYAAAKHGVRGFVRSLAVELRALRKPVRLALIAPGPVDTPFWRRARTSDRRLPPELRGAYRPDDVAAEVVRAIEGRGRTERTVGGLMVPAVFVDALAPNLVLGPLGVLARLGWRRREQSPPSHEDGLAQPTRSARRSGGLVSRPSLLARTRAGGASRR
ncbi:MAG: SDR family NAD(P)-dependent oxidoreductase [Solirubrobacterales bacterium]|nr:SDR family NAD(P)-dependent oxidoreductase [Solirubrobacterales bacterium]